MTALFGAQALDWVFKLLYAIHFQNIRRESQVAVHARQLVITLCSVTGNGATSTPQGETEKVQMLEKIVRPKDNVGFSCSFTISEGHQERIYNLV